MQVAYCWRRLKLRSLLPESVSSRSLRRKLDEHSSDSITLGSANQCVDWLRRFAENRLADLCGGRWCYRRRPGRDRKQQLGRLVRQAFNRTHDRLLPKITHAGEGRLRLRDMPPTLFHVHGAGSLLPDDDSWLASGDWDGLVRPMLAEYLETLVSDRRALISRFRTVDLAFKVVGVGSVGTRCLVLLLQDDFDQPLFLQLKEARPSVLEAYTDRSPHAHEGARVVAGQRLMQAVSDPFIGWTTGPAGRHFYIRQLRDMKAAVHLELLGPGCLTAYVRLCARVLARAHAKGSGRAAEIAGYIGRGTSLAEAMTRHALGYADLVEADFAEFREAVQSGRLPADVPALDGQVVPPAL